MSRSQPGRRRIWLRLLPLGSLLLLVLALAACAPSPALPAAPASAPSEPASAAATPVPPTAAPPTLAPQAATTHDLPAGVDADGNFYRGDPNAPVRLVEFSEFQ